MLTAKKQKKINRQLSGLEKRNNELITDQCFQYFVVFFGILFWDTIAQKLGFRYNSGRDVFQWVACAFALVGMLRCHWRMR